jgi:hypothetical protein
MGEALDAPLAPPPAKQRQQAQDRTEAHGSPALGPFETKQEAKEVGTVGT